MTPTQRTRDWLKRRGVLNAIVERWNSFAPRGDGGKGLRQDLFGFADILAIGPRIVAIQVTSGTNVAARVEKIYDTTAARTWLEAGGLIEVHGWRKAGPRGKRKTWQIRRVAIEIDGMGAMVSRECGDAGDACVVPQNRRCVEGRKSKCKEVARDNQARR